MDYYTVAIIAIGFLGESTFGFGGGFIMIPLLSIHLGVKDAVTFTLLFQFLMGFMIIPTYKHIHWKHFSTILPSLVIGSILGTYSLAIMNDDLLRKLLAVFIILFLVKAYFNNRLSIPRITSRVGTVSINAIAGWFQGAIGISSSIFVMYLSELKLPKRQFRATIILYLFVTSLIRIPASVHSGLLKKEVVMDAVPILPFFGIALIAGHFLHNHISETWYKIIVYAILIFSAISLLR